MSRYGLAGCDHIWHPREDGYEERCAAVICSLCGAFACVCDAIEAGQTYVTVRSRPELMSNSNITGFWRNPYVESPDICYWHQDDTDERLWYTDCGEAFTIEVGTPAENSMEYCCYCGRFLMEVI